MSDQILTQNTPTGNAGPPAGPPPGSDSGEQSPLSYRQQIIIHSLGEAANAVAAKNDDQVIMALAVALFNLPDQISRLELLFHALMGFKRPLGNWEEWGIRQ